MVGVSDFESSGERSSARDFNVLLAAGYFVAAFLLLVAILPTAYLVVGLLQVDHRLGFFAVVATLLGTADLVNRTPHVGRQVPQRFVRDLSPGFRGAVWGFDLGLLVTTQKTGSMLWVALIGSVVVGPPISIAFVLVAAGLPYLLGVWFLSGSAIVGTIVDLDAGERAFRLARKASAFLIFIIGALAILVVLHG